MRQAVIVSPEQLEVRTVDRPQLRHPGEILIRTAACGICSGDLMPWYLAKKVGTVLGHEMVGWAVEIGPSVQGISPGDLLFVHHHAPCLNCIPCSRGDHVHCPTWKQSHVDPGGMAEWLRIPEEIVRGDTFPVNDLSVEQALFIEPLACCVKAYHRLRGLLSLEGSLGGVIGCGIMGLLNIQTGSASGTTVVAIEPDPFRREFALKAGATQALTPDAAQQKLRHQLDFVIVGPGHPEIIQQALNLLRPAGVALLFTPTATGVLTNLDLGDLYFRDISLVPSYSCGPTDTRIASELIRTGKVKPQMLITHRFRIDDVQKAFDLARSGGSTIKVVVQLAEEAT